MTKTYIAALVLLLATALPGSAINPYRRYDAKKRAVRQQREGHLPGQPRLHVVRHEGRVQPLQRLPLRRFRLVILRRAPQHRRHPPPLGRNPHLAGVHRSPHAFRPAGREPHAVRRPKQRREGHRKLHQPAVRPAGRPVDRNRRRAVPLGRAHRPPLPLRAGGGRWQRVPRDPNHLRGQRRRNLGRNDRRAVPLPPQDGPLRPEREAQAGKLPAG